MRESRYNSFYLFSLQFMTLMKSTLCCHSSVGCILGGLLSYDQLSTTGGELDFSIIEKLRGITQHL